MESTKSAKTPGNKLDCQLHVDSNVQQVDPLDPGDRMSHHEKKKLVKRQLTGITLHEKLWPREGDWLIRSLRSALALFPPVNIGGVYHSCAMPERALTPWRILQQSVGTNSSLPLLKARKVYYKKIEKNIQIPYVVIMEMSGCVTEKVHLLMGAPSVILNVSGSSQSWLLNGKNRSMGNVKLLSSPCSCL